MDRDREHLQLLVIGHWIVAAFAGLFALFPVIHLVIGVTLASGKFHGTQEVPFDQLMGWFFILFSLAWILLGLAYAACIAIAGRCLSRRRNRAFCFVMAGISCGFFPFGTVLGVFTLLVLSRESVRALFPDGR